MLVAASWIWFLNSLNFFPKNIVTPNNAGVDLFDDDDDDDDDDNDDDDDGCSWCGWTDDDDNKRGGGFGKSEAGKR